MEKKEKRLLSIIFLVTSISVAALLAVIFFVDPANASRDEASHQREWCEANKGRAEVAMPNRTRADCLTATHAVEFDFARKWLESIGQSLNYAEQTGLRAGIVLICEKSGDKRKFAGLMRLVDHYNLPVDVWGLNCGDKRR